MSSTLRVPYALVDQLRAYYDSLPCEARASLGPFDEQEIIASLAEKSRLEWCDIRQTLFTRANSGE